MGLPSTMTNNSSAKRPLNPRTLIAHVLALIRATLTPGTILNASAIFVAPDWRMSSAVITKTAEGVCDNIRSVRETDVTRIFMRSSRLASDKSFFSCPTDATVAAMSHKRASPQDSLCRMVAEYFISRTPHPNRRSGVSFMANAVLEVDDSYAFQRLTRSGSPVHRYRRCAVKHLASSCWVLSWRRLRARKCKYAQRGSIKRSISLSSICHKFLFQ